MSQTYFQFKKFRIDQDKCSMKVGTDGVLLGAWCDVANCKKILDVGTGTGLITLMLAQRSLANIDGIEIDEEAVIQASANFKNSIWSNRIKIYHSLFQNFTCEKKYDLIVSNPPFFSNSFKSPIHSRNIARHTESLSFESLIQNSVNHLNDNGKLCVIIPFEMGERFIQLCRQENLMVKRICEVKTSPLKTPKRLLLEAKKEYNGLCTKEIITIETGTRHSYSSEYIELTKDFYLNF